MLFIFDLDGTLVTSNKEGLMEMRDNINNILLNKGVNASHIYSIFGKIDYGATALNDPSLKKKLRHKLELWEIQNAKSVTLISGTLDTLNDLLRKNHILALFTQNNAHVLNYLSEKFNLKQFFHTMLCRDMIKPKPDPSGLYYIMEETNESDAYFIGDSLLDIRCGKAAGIKTIGVHTGFVNNFYEVDKEDKPDIIIDSVKDLQNISFS